MAARSRAAPVACIADGSCRLGRPQGSAKKPGADTGHHRLNRSNGGEPMSTVVRSAPAPGAQGLSKEETRVIFASSLGTVFEWYDFYLYATLAPFFAALFFPKGNDTAALLSAFATYAAGFLVRPFGALVFGRVGDLVGRKYTFLVTIVVMGGATFAVGLLPTFATIR